MLPNVHSNSEIYGQTKAFHFFGQQVPIAGMIGDQQGALVGHLALSKGMVKNTYGTGSFIIMNTGDQLRFSENKLLTTIGFQIGEQLSYALEGSIFIAGSVIQWLRDGLEIIQDSKETQTMAQQSTNQDEIYLVPAFTGLGAPYWDSDARGSMFGITRGTTKNDIAKAALQSIAYQSKDVLETMIKDTGIAIPSLQVDGGATANEYLMQFQADIMNVPIKRPDMAETTAFGAAMLAGLAVGFWESIAEIAALHTQMKEFTPLMDETKIEELYSGWKKAVAATQLFKK
jgi:glycerol kinase